MLRTALGLSLATRTPFRIDRIRGRRAKPGLLRQHLTAVRTAATIGQARVEGEELGNLVEKGLEKSARRQTERRLEEPYQPGIT